MRSPAVSVGRKAAAVIVGAIGELQRSFIKDRVKGGLKWERPEGNYIDRPKLELDHDSILEGLARSMSLNELARKHPM